MHNIKIEIGPKTKAVIEETVGKCPESSHQKGDARDKPREFSKNKMRCAFYVAIGIPGMKISGMIGIGYGTVRTWKGEKRFKGVVTTITHFLDKDGLQRRHKKRRSSSERRKSKVYGR